MVKTASQNRCDGRLTLNIVQRTSGSISTSTRGWGDGVSYVNVHSCIMHTDAVGPLLYSQRTERVSESLYRRRSCPVTAGWCAEQVYRAPSSSGVGLSVTEAEVSFLRAAADGRTDSR